MPFDLTNAPFVFQRPMDYVLVYCVSFAWVNIDNILIVSESWSEHVVHLRRLCEVLRGRGSPASVLNTFLERGNCSS